MLENSYICRFTNTTPTGMFIRQFTLLFALLCTLCPAPLMAETITADTLPPLRQRIARMFIVGFRGTEITSSMRIIKDIEQLGVGGVVLFEHNIAPVSPNYSSSQRLATLCHQLDSIATYPFIVSIDQEGGAVNRLKTKYGFVPTVSHGYLGRINSEDTTRYYAATTAEQLVEIGFNTNFAPCTDVNINPQCPVIGKRGRSISADPTVVTKHARYIIEEHQQRGVITAMKHFPGHGSSTTDTHTSFTDVTKSWQPQELAPYRALTAADEAHTMVMVSHVFNAQIDSVYPATLSHATITGLLRQDIGWQGVVVTDDMGMKAIADHYTLPETLQLVINAGCDLLIFSSNVGETPTAVSATTLVDTVMQLVEEGIISEERINESYYRITLLGENFK